MQSIMVSASCLSQQAKRSILYLLAIYASPQSLNVTASVMPRWKRCEEHDERDVVRVLRHAHSLFQIDQCLDCDFIGTHIVMGNLSRAVQGADSSQ
jgi:hypothetical protein